MGHGPGALGDLATRMSAPSSEPLRRLAGKRVLVTGHTGFKGSWLLAWLRALGSHVTGLSLAPDKGSLFETCAMAEACAHREGDIRQLAAVRAALDAAAPDVVFHLAAQALVRKSYDQPLATVETNVLGTAHLLEALRQSGGRCAVVGVTSDKCYENPGRPIPLEEHHPMGGHDVYSMSKGAAELLVSSYRRSFFPPERLASHGVALATVRAGNCIGGGDASPDRLLPDVARALAAGRPVVVRNPAHIRPWQHVLEPLAGYLLLAARLVSEDDRARAEACDAFNFGPDPEGALSVREVVERAIAAWGAGEWVDASDPAAPHEAQVLLLETRKARARLGWRPRLSLEEAIGWTVAWYRARAGGGSARELRAVVDSQLAAYVERMNR